MYNQIRKRGFSLIELLISVTLITTIIALTNVIYSNYVASDLRFSERSQLYTDLPEVTDVIRHKISRLNEVRGSETVNSTQCDWSQTDSQKKQESGFNLETGQLTTGGVSFELSVVEVSCTNKNQVIKPFEIKVLSVDDGGDVNFG